MNTLLKFIKLLISIFTVKKETPDILPSDLQPNPVSDANVPIDGPKPKRETLAEKIAAEAYLKLGTDASPSDKADDELGCAESVTTILHRVIPEVPVILSTQELYKFLNKSSLFKRILDPVPGCIVVSPTVQNGSQITRGHTGIYLDYDKIASNNSRKGIWEQNYTRARWIAYFHDHQGLKGYLYAPVD